MEWQVYGRMGGAIDVNRESGLKFVPGGGLSPRIRHPSIPQWGDAHMAVTYQDYYKLLGVDRNATAEQISRAFKKLARQYHPDLNPGDKKAEEKFKEINEAYEVLKDPEKRKLYDQFGADWQHGQQFSGNQGFENMHFNFDGQNMGGGADFSDFFESIFGGGSRGASFDGFSRRPRRGRDVEAELPLTLEEVMQGGKRQVTLQMPTGPRTLEVNVPQGIKDGAKLRLSGQGDPSSSGGQPGDLFLRIRYLPNRNFKVDGENLHYELELAPWEAVLGAKVQVPTLDGHVELKIPAGSGSGRKFRLRGKGLGSPSARGDLLVKVMIDVPTELSGEEKELWEKIAETSKFRPRSA